MINKKLLILILSITTWALQSADIYEHTPKKISEYTVSFHCLQRMAQRKVSEAQLKRVLETGKWSTKAQDDIQSVSLRENLNGKKIKTIAIVITTDKIIKTVYRETKKRELPVATSNLDYEHENVSSKGQRANQRNLNKKQTERRNNLPSKYPHKFHNINPSLDFFQSKTHLPQK